MRIHLLPLFDSFKQTIANNTPKAFPIQPSQAARFEYSFSDGINNKTIQTICIRENSTNRAYTNFLLLFIEIAIYRGEVSNYSTNMVGYWWLFNKEPFFQLP